MLARHLPSEHSNENLSHMLSTEIICTKHQHTPSNCPNYQYSCFIYSISQDAYASLHPCVRSPFQQIRWGIPQSRRDGPCPQMDARWNWNETSKIMGGLFVKRNAVRVFLLVFVSCPGSSCWTWKAWCLFVLWKPCVNIKVLTFTVHQDAGATTNQFAVNANPRIQHPSSCYLTNSPQQAKDSVIARHQNFNQPVPSFLLLFTP